MIPILIGDPPADPAEDCAAASEDDGPPDPELVFDELPHPATPRRPTTRPQLKSAWVRFMSSLASPLAAPVSPRPADN
jgi:hypothetical protein